MLYGPSLLWGAVVLTYVMNEYLQKHPEKCNGIEGVKTMISSATMSRVTNV
jgi:hypothetical protein